MRAVRTIGWMTRKELLRFAADPLGAVFTLTVPVFLAVLMSVLFAPSDTIEPLPLVVASTEASPRVERLVRALSEDPGLRVTRLPPDQAEAAVLDNEAAAAVVFGEGANDALQPLSMFSGNAVPVRVLFDPSRAVEVDILQGLLMQKTMAQLSGELGTEHGRTRMFNQLRLMSTASPLLGLDDKARWIRFAEAGAALEGGDVEGGGMPLDIERVSLEVFNPKARWNPHAHYFAGMLTMFLMFLAATSALNLINERDEGALTRVRLTGAPPIAVLLGGSLGTTIIAFAAALLVYVCGIAVFDIHVGQPLGLLAMLVAVSHLVGGFSLLLSAIGNTARQISAVAPFVILVMGFIGGSAMPSFMMPGWVQQLAVFLPTTWANEGLAAATWRGASLIECLQWAFGVMGFSAGFAGLGIVLFRWD